MSRAGEAGHWGREGRERERKKGDRDERREGWRERRMEGEKDGGRE